MDFDYEQDDSSGSFDSVEPGLAPYYEDDDDDDNDEGLFCCHECAKDGSNVLHQ